jgi:hypothetical protein
MMRNPCTVDLTVIAQAFIVRRPVACHTASGFQLKWSVCFPEVWARDGPGSAESITCARRAAFQCRPSNGTDEVRRHADRRGTYRAQYACIVHPKAGLSRGRARE